MSRLQIGLFVTALVVGSAVAQEKRPSPPAQTSITLGGKAITIKYSAPYAKGRKIFGGLVPYGEVWRFGANEATSLSTAADLKIGDLAVPKGSYTLYMLAGENESFLIVNKQTGQWGTEYSQGQDLGRVKLTKKATSKPVEQFSVKLHAGKSSGAVLETEWENTEFTVPIALAN